VILQQGCVVWVDLSPTRGKEQRGHRPAVVASANDYLSAVTDMAIILPCTTVFRNWANHVELTGPTGLADTTFVMTEQVRTVDRTRITDVAGTVSDSCLFAIGVWLDDWLGIRER